MVSGSMPNAASRWPRRLNLETATGQHGESRKNRNPKAEGRRKSEGRGPKRGGAGIRVSLRPSALRVSDFFGPPFSLSALSFLFGAQTSLSSDPYMSLLMSQPKTEIASNVVAAASFDPPFVRTGRGDRVPGELQCAGGVGCLAGETQRAGGTGFPRRRPRADTLFQRDEPRPAHDVQLSSAGAAVGPVHGAGVHSGRLRQARQCAGGGTQRGGLAAGLDAAGARAGLRRAGNQLVRGPDGEGARAAGCFPGRAIADAQPGADQWRGGAGGPRGCAPAGGAGAPRGGHGACLYLRDGADAAADRQAYCLRPGLLCGQSLFRPSSRRQRPGAGSPSTSSEFTLLDSQPVELQVRPLPRQGELPGFTGAIGSFSLEPPRLAADPLRAGETVKLSVTVHGDGNVGRLAAPPPPQVRDWQVFAATPEPLPPPSPLAVLPRQPPVAQGSATFLYTLVPLTTAARATPPIPFSYFDPKRAAYVDLTIPAVPVTVRPGEKGGDLASWSKRTGSRRSLRRSRV